MNRRSALKTLGVGIGASLVVHAMSATSSKSLQTSNLICHAYSYRSGDNPAVSTAKNFEIRSDNDVRLPARTLKLLREALEAADRRGCNPSLLHVRINDTGISVWEDKPKTSEVQT